MIHSVALVILKMVLVCLALSVAALLVGSLILLKVAVQEFIKEFGLKKTVVVVATMALVLLSVATTKAGEVVKLEGNSLVYYQTTKEIPNVPNGITAEQARQLVEGKTPVVSFSKEEGRFYWGLPLTKTTKTSVSFRDGWIKDEKSGDESLSVTFLFTLFIIITSGFVIGSSRSSTVGIVVIVAPFLISFLAAGLPFPGNKGLPQVVGIIMTWLFFGYSFGLFLRYLRRRKEKRQNAGNGLTAEPT